MEDTWRHLVLTTTLLQDRSNYEGSLSWILLEHLGLSTHLGTTMTTTLELEPCLNTTETTETLVLLEYTDKGDIRE